jgi:hypothetical protein
MDNDKKKRNEAPDEKSKVLSEEDLKDVAGGNAGVGKMSWLDWPDMNSKGQTGSDK